MKRIDTRYLLAAVAVTAMAGIVAAAANEEAGPPSVLHRTNPHDSGAPTAGSTGSISPAITYHGGSVMGAPTAYVIWYGNWNQANGSDTSTGKQIVSDFLTGLDNSPYYNINVSYGGPTGRIQLGAQTTDAYSNGSRLSDAKVQAVVRSALTSNRLPTDTNGIYLVLTSSDVSESSGFCTRYCGWHTAATLNGANIKYSFVGNANRCLSSCAAQTTGPNGNAGVDGMVSVIAHELEEANTDPNPASGWVDSNGAENADKCAWTFGSAQS